MNSASDYQPQQWESSSNEALKISLISADANEGAIQFLPNFTYPIFGDSETIYGYKDLVIHLVFDSITYKPFLNVKYSEKLADANPQIDIIDKLLNFLPVDDIILKDESKWVDTFTEERQGFDIPSLGEKVSEYTSDNDDETFSIYKFSISDFFTKDKKSPVIKYWERVQIFTILYIEAATYLNLKDESNWNVYFIFNKSTNAMIGYTTTYKYWNYSNGTKFDESDKLKYREKISQFLIMPPYQGHGHGSHLYQSLYNKWLQDESIIELTVEDPNEQFDDLRDRNDLEMLYNTSDLFKNLKEMDTVSDEWIELQRNQFKLEKRQFNRLIEMILLYLKKVSLFKDIVKRRIYIKNYDSLCDIEDQDMKLQAINESYNLVKEDYERIIKLCKKLK